MTPLSNFILICSSPQNFYVLSRDYVNNNLRLLRNKFPLPFENIPTLNKLYKNDISSLFKNSRIIFRKSRPNNFPVKIRSVTQI